MGSSSETPDQGCALEAQSAKRETVADFWSCPICLEMVYKPCVNSCGHVFCFWCMHRAMNTFEKSKCPCCRSEYSYFPWICEKLHEYLSLTFADDYEARARATAEEEESMEARAPEVETASAFNGDSILQCFTCADPACREVLFRPTVLNCGHMVCMESCAYDSNGFARNACPACSAPLVGKPYLCHKVHEFLQAVIPEVQSKRAIDVNLIVNSRQAAASGSGASNSAHAEEAPTETNAKVNDEDYLERLNEMKKHFVHHGVGCDVCGMYPIVGPRFRCAQCSASERMGYDMCGKCMTANPETCRGRFNQHHTSDHVMEEVEARPSLIHIFQAMNPGVPLSHLQDLLRMQYAPENGDDADVNDFVGDIMEDFDFDVEVEIREDVLSAHDRDDSGVEDQTVGSSPAQQSASPGIAGVGVQQPDLNSVHTQVPMFHRIPAWQSDSDAALEQALNTSSTDASENADSPT